MMSRIFLVLMLVLVGSVQARACRYIPRPLPENIREAKVAFVGTVRTVENGLAVFTVEKELAGVKDGDEYDVDMPKNPSSCSDRFAAGQRWLFLGRDAPSGSLLLQDEEGRVITGNLAAVEHEIGTIPGNGSDVRHGTIAASCAPWDGAAFSLRLDNGVNAMVYVDLSELDRKDKNAVVSYSANGKSERGSASITQCPVPKAGQAENLPCQSLPGTVSIGAVTPDDVTGSVETTSGEYHSRYVFHVKRSKERALCG